MSRLQKTSVTYVNHSRPLFLRLLQMLTPQTPLPVISCHSSTLVSGYVDCQKLKTIITLTEAA